MIRCRLQALLAPLFVERGQNATLQFGHNDSQGKPTPFEDRDQILAIVAAAGPGDDKVSKPKRRNDDWDSLESLCYSDSGAKGEQDNNSIGMRSGGSQRTASKAMAPQLFVSQTSSPSERVLSSTPSKIGSVFSPMRRSLISVKPANSNVFLKVVGS